MKRFLIILFLLCISLQISHAQSKSSIKFSAGYGFPMASNYITENSTITANQTGYYTFESTRNAQGVYGSYGTGLQVMASFQNMITKNIGFEIGIQYLTGKKYNGSHQSTVTYGGITENSGYKNTIRSEAAFIVPAIILTTGEGVVRPYFSAGVCLGKANVTDDYNLTSGSEKATYITRQRGNYPLGFRGGIGATYQFSSRIDFFAEINFMGMTYYPKEKEVTEYTVNGRDQLNDLDENEKKIIYKKSVSYNNTTNSSGLPYESLRQSLPFSNWSLNMGIKISLGLLRE